MRKEDRKISIVVTEYVDPEVNLLFHNKLLFYSFFNSQKFQIS